MRPTAVIILFAATLVLPGCVVRTAADIITAPVRIGAKAIDLATVSQSERDEKRGRELRRDSERLGALARAREDFAMRCNRGDAKACTKARDAHDEMLAILARSPQLDDADQSLID